MDKKYLKKFIAAASVAILVVAVFILSNSKKISNFVVENIYRPFAKAMSFIVAKIPFSVFEFCSFIFVFIMIILLVLMFINIKQKQKEKALNYLSIIVLSVVCVTFIYTFTANFLYKRDEAVYQKEQTLIEDDKAFIIAKTYLENLNNLARENTKNGYDLTICPHEDVTKIIIEEVEKQITDPYYIETTIAPKPIFHSYLMSLFSISGITFIPFVEPCYNKDAPDMSKVLTITHEIMHTKGVMREYKANLLSFYILLNSEDIYLRYVGYLFALPYIRDVFILTNNFEYYSNFNFYSNILKDIDYYNKWWDERNKMAKVGDFFNNLYLKSNGQDGVKSYMSYAKYEKYFDETLNKDIYVVKEYSSVQNMIFALLK